MSEDLKYRVAKFYNVYHQTRNRKPDKNMQNLYWPLLQGRVLELGVGTRIPESADKDQYVGVDFSIEAIKRLQKMGHLGVIADVEMLPFADRSFNTLACYDVLEHIPNPEKMLAEMCRISANCIVIAGPNYIGNTTGILDRTIVNKLIKWAFISRWHWQSLEPYLIYDEGWKADADAITAVNSAWVTNYLKKYGWKIRIVLTWPNEFVFLNRFLIFRHLGSFMLVVAYM